MVFRAKRYFLCESKSINMNLTSPQVYIPSYLQFVCEAYVLKMHGVGSKYEHASICAQSPTDSAGVC